jgi:hypothetical protein
MDRDELAEQARYWSQRAVRTIGRGLRELRRRAEESDIDEHAAAAATSVRDHVSAAVSDLRNRVAGLNGEQRIIIVGLVALIIASAVVSPMMLSGPSGPSNSEVREGTVSQETPDGYSEVPDERVTTTTPDRDELPEPEVRASVGSQTMEVTATERDGDPVLTVSDDRIHNGRWVSLNTKWFHETLGGVPERAYITHESGDSYSTQVHVRDNEVVFYIEEFSTNQVEFSGEVSLSGDDATDGTQYQYELDDLEEASDVQGRFVGVEATEWDNASASGLGDGDTLDVSPASDEVRGPSNGEPEVVFTGEVQQNSQTESGSGVSPSGSASVSVGGNIDTANGQLELTANQYYDHNVRGDDYSASTYSSGSWESVTFSTVPDTLEKVRIKMYDPSPTTADVQIYVLTNGQNYTFTGLNDWQMTSEYETRSNTYGVTTGSDITIKFRTEGEQAYLENVDFWGPAPSNVDVEASDGTSVSFGDFTGGETKTKTLNVAAGTSSLDFQGSGGGSLDWSFSRDERTATENPGSDLDGDGSDEITHSGVLLDGETATYQASSLSPGDDMATISTVGGSTVGVEVRLQEVVETRDPTVEVNGEVVGSHTGTLAAGESSNYTASSSLLQEGTNNVTVSVDDSGLSSDAPEPKVGFEYSHDATSRQSVEYAAEHWSERYNVSKTYASAQTDATLTIPFQGNVLGVRSIETRSNNSNWQSVPESDYKFDNTTLTVSFGNVSADEEVAVRATATKVQVGNGEIQVLNPSKESGDLATRVEVVDKQSEDFHISYAGTSGQIYYTENESWSDVESYHFADSSGHKRVYAPNAQTGSTFHVHDYPVTARPLSGDVHITDVGENETEPAFNVTYGNQNSGDEVEYTFQNASDGTDYVLYSQTKGLVRDSGTASSPLTLTDDDSPETLIFLIDDGDDGGDSGSGDSGTGPVPLDPAGNGDASWIPLGGVALALAGLVLAGNDPDAVRRAASDLGNAVDSLLSAIPYVGSTAGDIANTLVSSAGNAVATLVANNVVVMALSATIVIGAIQGGIIALPEGSLVIVVVAGVALASLIVLRDLEEFTMQRWAVIVVVAAVLAVEAMSDTDTSIIAALTSSDVFPIIALGLLYIAYKAVQGLRSPDEQNTIVVSGNIGGGDNQ